MRRVNYPIDNKILQQLKDDYLAIFSKELPNMQRLWKIFRDYLRTLNNNSDESQRLYPDKVEDLLIADYERLVDVYINYRKIRQNNSGCEQLDSKLSHLFHYSGVKGSPFPAFQPKISHYFMEHAKILDVYVCNYCEMAYINEFGLQNRYTEIAWLLLSGTENEICRYIRKSDGKKLSSKTINKIMKLRDDYDETNIVNAFDNMLEWKNMKASTKKSDQVMGRLYNHFDLDHFLPKSKCPLVGLSLFNFVPSCSVCNEKLKRDEELSINRDELLALSPTSPNYAFNEKVTIKVVPYPGANWLRAQEHEQDFHIELLTDESYYQKEIELFHLDERYNYHKCEALRLQDKLLEYPDAKLCMMSSALSGGVYTPQKIQEDLFEEEFIKKEHRCFSKMKQDIMKQMRKNYALTIKS